jgi:hypothetical protein
LHQQCHQVALPEPVVLEGIHMEIQGCP